jgi:hypothetical protein
LDGSLQDGFVDIGVVKVMRAATSKVRHDELGISS